MLAVAIVARQEIAGQRTLAVVAADQAEDVAATLLGQARMGRIRRDHQDVEGFVEAGRQQRGVRAHVPDHEAHAGVDQLARGCHGLLEAAGVVGLDQPHLLAENAAARVQVLDGQRDRGTVAAARGRVGAAQGIGEADRDVGRDRSGQHARDDDGERAEMMLVSCSRLALLGWRPARRCFGRHVGVPCVPGYASDAPLGVSWLTCEAFSSKSRKAPAMAADDGRPACIVHGATVQERMTCLSGQRRAAGIGAPLGVATGLAVIGDSPRAAAARPAHLLAACRARCRGVRLRAGRAAAGLDRWRGPRSRDAGDAMPA